ncbi:MAG: tRNA uridine-5-carboxymethylaminomethyl(34) synthesis GTPase MnmE [Alistipes sp.]|uniref:tRNA uridine-5-carboxymethylaminomethyl(34) synthesis GTPase MnmE n=1 Tax=Alistipes sp. TaxID=1872444 RepID=UPI0025C0D762|nr:tRNA uridine-5-carboxymethylaminomethyl(34) synthesis GTPase MnmE [Alistipes sp.]MCD8276089.1 tRNA uridine-5-carboxymethylaminomethyl(34) synthesis GTPase MnmE [Alistipes sp.]
MICDHDTIAAPATAAGGALAVVRVSGGDALTVCDRIFRGRTPLAEAEGYTVHYGHIMADGRTLDDVLVTVFRAPRSYTGEDAAEISCHGSQYIVSEILRLLIAAGARMAQPGEFTIRAYLAGKLDLSQAEAVADIIASSSQASHALAANQMRGGYSEAFDTLREKLLHLTSLLELELDFSEEEVEFADRTQLRDTMQRIKERIDALRSSFSLGNAIKEGVAVAIVGAPNVGKSTLLNRLLNEERAMVSDIAGTTRDVIEERANIDGIVFRFLDTAGIRSTNDTLEQMGIARTMSSIERAQIIIRLIDASQPDISASDESSASGQTVRKSAPAVPSADSAAGAQHPEFPLRPDQTLLTVYNKIDKTPRFALPEGAVGISARNGDGIDDLRRALRNAVDTEALYHGDTVISNSRHYEALTSASEALSLALDGLRNNLPTDLLSEEIRQVIRHLSGVTGQDIVPEDVLKTIFSKFCIGK